MKYWTILFISRNKDNRDIANFHQRSECHYVATEGDWNPAGKVETALTAKFYEFVRKGKESEFCRFYRSLNERNNETVRQELICHLVRNPDTKLEKLDTLLCKLADRHEHSLTHKWLFDVDTDKTTKNAFCALLPVPYTCYETPHGFAVVTDRGFDNRQLLETIKQNGWDITLKKESPLLLMWAFN